MSEVTEFVDELLADFEAEFIRLCKAGDLTDNLVQRIGWYTAMRSAITEEPCDDPEIQQELVNRLNDVMSFTRNSWTDLELLSDFFNRL
jgi:hypothetical protein